MNRTRNQADHELKARARIYVANIPAAGMTRKEVVSVFNKYGEIDSKFNDTRYIGYPVFQLLKKYHFFSSDVSLQTRHVFVQFVEESSALKALAQNPPDYIMSKKLGMKYECYFYLVLKYICMHCNLFSQFLLQLFLFCIQM